VAADNITLIAGNADGTDSANGSSRFPVYSPTGHAIAFVSSGSNFGPTDTNFNPGCIRSPPAKTSVLIGLASTPDPRASSCQLRASEANQLAGGRQYSERGRGPGDWFGA
jgi:hypothetical protein